MKRISIATRSRTLIVTVAIFATLGCNRAGSSRTQARPLKPTPATKSHVVEKPAERGSTSAFLPTESW